MKLSLRALLAFVLVHAIAVLLVGGSGVANAQVRGHGGSTSEQALAGGRITGTVSAEPAGDLLMEAVTVYRWAEATANEPAQWKSAGFTDIRADGSYATDVLPAGTYRVGVFAPHDYASSFYPDAGSVHDAADVVVADGDRTGIDLALTRGGSISGTIRTNTGAAPAVADTFVLLQFRDARGVWHEHSMASIGADGTWSRGRLASGAYRLQFLYTAPSGVSFEEFWDDQPTAATATPVTVVDGQAVSGLGVVLDRMVGGPAYAPSTWPTVTGEPRVGDTLTANPGVWTPAEATFTYSWLADGVVIAGATGSTFVPTDSLVGRRISVAVDASGALARDGRAVSAQTARVAAAPVLENTGRPVIKGKARVGKKLRATKGTWSLTTGLTVRYAWYAGSKRIKKATRATLRLRKAQRGKRVTVRVTAVVPGMKPVTVRSRATRKVRR